MEEDIKQLITENILEFLDSDYGKGFLTGIKLPLRLLPNKYRRPQKRISVRIVNFCAAVRKLVLTELPSFAEQVLS